jgi:hypothetical protein
MSLREWNFLKKFICESLSEIKYSAMVIVFLIVLTVSVTEPMESASNGVICDMKVAFIHSFIPYSNCTAADSGIQAYFDKNNNIYI